MSTFWTRPHVYGDPDDGMVVHTPEEAVVATRNADGSWIAEAHTTTAEAVLLRKRWQAVQPPVQPVTEAKTRRRKSGG